MNRVADYVGGALLAFRASGHLPSRPQEGDRLTGHSNSSNKIAYVAFPTRAGQCGYMAFKSGNIALLNLDQAVDGRHGSPLLAPYRNGEFRATVKVAKFQTETLPIDHLGPLPHQKIRARCSINRPAAQPI